MTRTSLIVLAALLAGCASEPSHVSLGERSGEYEPLNVEVMSESWSFNGEPGRRIITPSFQIMTTVTHPIVIDRFPAFVEMALAHYSTSLTLLPKPTERMDTYLFSGRAQWDKLTMQLTGADAAMYLKIERGGYARDGVAVLYDIGTRDTFAIAAHEGWHQFTQSTFEQQLPVWLDEGIAAYMEGYRWDPSAPDRPLFLPWSNAERFDQLRNAYNRGTLVPLERLLSQRPQDLISGGGSDATLTYYAQVWALTLFLAEYDAGRYRPGLELVLNDAQSGRLVARVRELNGRSGSHRLSTRRGTEVFVAYFDPDLERASKAYDEFVDRIVTTAQKNEINDGVSPLE